MKNRNKYNFIIEAIAEFKFQCHLSESRNPEALILLVLLDSDFRQNDSFDLFCNFLYCMKNIFAFNIGKNQSTSASDSGISAG